MNRSLEPFASGDRVKWKWGSHWAEGMVREGFTARGERVIRGARIVQDDDPQVLKKHSELFRA